MPQHAVGQMGAGVWDWGRSQTPAHPDFLWGRKSGLW